MRKTLAILSILVFLGAGLFILISSLNRKKDVYLTPDIIQDFDSKTVPESRSNLTVSAVRRSAPSLAEGQRGPLPYGQAPVSARWALGNRMLQAFLAEPGRFIAQRTLLAKPASFMAFIRDRGRVERYLKHPLIRAVLESPELTRAVAGRPGVLHGFLSSPAMQDPRAVSELAKSALLKELSGKQGIQALLEDADFVQKILMDAKTMEWLGRNPDAARAFQVIGKSPRRS